ncbi:PA14 domain-containing protein [Streptomyces glaucescens]|uniref:PA14 domain-containing protein n=1 Tax=Streptomyces glaucescens TaxID=1907 RepID=UPI00344DA13A
MNPARHSTAALSATVVLATAGGLLTTAAAPATAATSCASPVFTRQFFANTTFSGTPKKTDCDSTVNENWGTGAPASGLPRDHFGVRWTVTRDFGSGGPFTFSASAQDGIRVHLDGVRRIDLWKNVSTTAGTSVNLTIPPGRHTLRVDFVNWTGAANTRFTYAPRTSATVDKVAPLVPAGAKVTYDSATSRAKLTWSRNKEMDLAGYGVHRRLKGTTTWTKLATTTATSYTDTTLPATGATYYYEIRAHDKAGNSSKGTADQGVTTADRTAPAVPRNLTAAPGRDANALSWTAVAGAASYEVVRATAENGPYERIATLQGTAYADLDAPVDIPAAYKVRARDAAGNASAYSSPVWATRDTIAPAPPNDLKAVSEDDSGVTLGWTGSNPDTVRHLVYRASSSAGPRTRIGTTTTWNHRDITGDPGQPYVYYVTAVDAAGNESAPAQVTATRRVGPNAAPKAPSLGLARIVGDRLLLSWNQGGYVPVSGYTVYRSRSATVDTSDPANVYATTTATSLERTVAADERDYHYAVVAHSAYDVRSPASASVLPTVSAPQPPPSTTVYEVETTATQVRLVWAAVPIGPAEPEITGYRVYVSTRPGVTKADAEQVHTTPGTDLWVPTPESGRPYYFAVSAVNAAGLESELSPEVSATPGT